MATGLLGIEVIPINPLLNPQPVMNSFGYSNPRANIGNSNRILGNVIPGMLPLTAFGLLSQVGNFFNNEPMSAQDVIDSHLSQENNYKTWDFGYTNQMSEAEARNRGIIIPPDPTVTDAERKKNLTLPNIPPVFDLPQHTGDTSGQQVELPQHTGSPPVEWDFPIHTGDTSPPYVPTLDDIIMRSETNEGLLQDVKEEEKVNEGILGEFQEGEGMLVIHNTGASAIENYEKIGGIPKPSLAIIPEDIEEMKFGEITLIGDPELMIPSGQNPVYKGDAYTQRYPIVRTLYSDDEMNKIIKHFSDIFEVDDIRYDYDKIADYTFEDGSRQDVFYAGNLYNQIIEEGINNLPSDMMDMAFLKQKGLLPDFNLAKDKYEYRRLLDKVWTPELNAEYKEWNNNLTDTIGVQGKEKIIVGRTDMGKLKYKDHTLDNVLQHMKTKAGKEVGFGATSVGSLAAIMRGKFKTKKELSKARSSLVSSTEMNDIKSKLYSDLYALTEKLTEENEFLKDRNTDLADNFINIFSDKKYSIESNFKEFYPHTSEATKKEVIKFLEKLADTPTEYFEVKPNRAVGIHEFKGAIVPMNTDEKTLQIFRDNGIEIKKYNTEKDRINKLKEFEDLFASLPPNPLFQIA